MAGDVQKEMRAARNVYAAENRLKWYDAQARQRLKAAGLPVGWTRLNNTQREALTDVQHALYSVRLWVAETRKAIEVGDIDHLLQAYGKLINAQVRAELPEYHAVRLSEQQRKTAKKPRPRRPEVEAAKWYKREKAAGGEVTAYRMHTYLKSRRFKRGISESTCSRFLQKFRQNIFPQ